MWVGTEDSREEKYYLHKETRASTYALLSAASWLTRVDGVRGARHPLSTILGAIPGAPRTWQSCSVSLCCFRCTPWFLNGCCTYVVYVVPVSVFSAMLRLLVTCYASAYGILCEGGSQILEPLFYCSCWCLNAPGFFRGPLSLTVACSVFACEVLNHGLFLELALYFRIQRHLVDSGCKYGVAETGTHSVFCARTVEIHRFLGYVDDSPVVVPVGVQQQMLGGSESRKLWMPTVAGLEHGGHAPRSCSDSCRRSSSCAVVDVAVLTQR